jgi:hypothetical protein
MRGEKPASRRGNQVEVPEGRARDLVGRRHHRQVGRQEFDPQSSVSIEGEGNLLVGGRDGHALGLVAARAAREEIRVERRAACAFRFIEGALVGARESASFESNPNRSARVLL